MLYRCRKCGHEEARGCLPAVSCGMLLMAYAAVYGVLVGLAVPALERIWFHDGLGWRWVFVAILLIPCEVAIHYAAQLTEWLAFCLKRCPGCGTRRWSWGFTRGFGL